MQNKFTFSKEFQRLYPQKYISPTHFSPQGELRAEIIKKGYIVKDLRIELMVKVFFWQQRQIYH